MISRLQALTTAPSQIVVAAPGSGPGYWAGGPSAVVDGDSDAVWLAYRLRRPVGNGRGYANVVARLRDGVHAETVATLTSAQFGAASLERPALVRRPDGGWRVYVSCATENSKHWWVEAIDAPAIAELAEGTRTVVLPGDDSEAFKDVVVRVVDRQWRMWACRHPLDGGDDEADRMSTYFGTSADGLTWSLDTVALAPRAGEWDARGTRVADVIEATGRWWAFYDGRRNASENWQERTGLAVGDSPDHFEAVAGPAPAEAGSALRYVSWVEHDGGLRGYFEQTAADGSHDLRTVYIPRPSADSQSE